MEHSHLLTSTDETTFHIECTLQFDSSKRSFCVQAADKMGEGATIGMRPCVPSDPSQMWFMDKIGQLRLKARDHLCLIWNDKGHLTMSPYCKSDIYTDFKDSPEYPFVFNMEEKAIIAVTENTNKALGVSKKNNYAAMKLFSLNGNNPSIYKFYLTSVIYKSESSSAPSDVPSTSANPSAPPSDIPSLSMSPSAAPSDLPSVSLNPSSAPSDLPSTSANPSAPPSDIPSLSMSPSASPTREKIAPTAGNVINSSNNEMNGSVQKSKAAVISLILLAITVFLIATFIAYKFRKRSRPPELYHAVVQSRDSSTRVTRAGGFFRMFGPWSKSGSIDSASSYNTFERSGFGADSRSRFEARLCGPWSKSGSIDSASSYNTFFDRSDFGADSRSRFEARSRSTLHSSRYQSTSYSLSSSSYSSRSGSYDDDTSDSSY